MLLPERKKKNNNIEYKFKKQRFECVKNAPLSFGEWSGRRLLWASAYSETVQTQFM